MIAIPAVDLRDGRCVQLVGGSPEDERVSLPDPVAVARSWWSRGFEALHVVDLDAALGLGDNLPLLEDLATATPAVVQVGGGVRSTARAEALLRAGADRVIVGTRALSDPEWLTRLSTRHPDRIVLAADIRNGQVVTRGWTETTTTDVASLLDAVASLPLAGVLVTDVGREGRMRGMDRDRVAHVLAATRHPVLISGGVTTVGDLAWLHRAGASAAVLGMALYTGALDAAVAAERWGRRPVSTPHPTTEDAS